MGSVNSVWMVGVCVVGVGKPIRGNANHYILYWDGDRYNDCISK
jgi:hypothetical protein